MVSYLEPVPTPSPLLVVQFSVYFLPLKTAHVPGQQFSLALGAIHRTKLMYAIVVSTFQPMDMGCYGYIILHTIEPGGRPKEKKKQSHMFAILLAQLLYDVKWSPGTLQ